MGYQRWILVFTDPISILAGVIAALFLLGLSHEMNKLEEINTRHELTETDRGYLLHMHASALGTTWRTVRNSSIVLIIGYFLHRLLIG